MKAAVDNTRNEEWVAKWRAASRDLKLVLQCGQEREQLVRTRIHTGKCIEVYGTNTGACHDAAVGIYTTLVGGGGSRCCDT